MYSEINEKKYNFYFLIFNKTSVKVCSRLPLSEDKRATNDDLTFFRENLQILPIPFVASLHRRVSTVNLFANESLPYCH